MRLITRRRWASLSAVAALATAGAIAPGTSASATPPEDSGVVVATGYVQLGTFPSDPNPVPDLTKTGTGTAGLCVNGVALDDNLKPYVYADGVANPAAGGPPNT
ncbi:MAG: hypothetical protein QOC82_710, partial [Frankiaceae bacterium]|nr:hypothetical protein [Frankiaceae bacterium]